MRLLHAAAKTRARFDDPNLVSHAGLVPAARLAENVGLEDLVDEYVHVAAKVGANPGLKIGSLLAGLVAGADDIDGMDLLRHGALSATFGGVRAPSTLGSFLRAFDHGTVRTDPKVRRTVTSIDEGAWVPIKYPNAIWDAQAGQWISDAEIAEVPYTAFASSRAHRTDGRLIARRVKRLNPRAAAQGQGELFATYRYHVVFTDSPFPLVQAESHHRGHALIEQVFADLIAGPLAHRPSGRFPANAAWLQLAVTAHALTRAWAPWPRPRTPSLVAPPSAPSSSPSPPAPPAAAATPSPGTYPKPGPGKTPGTASSTPPTEPASAPPIEVLRPWPPDHRPARARPEDPQWKSRISDRQIPRAHQTKHPPGDQLNPQK